MSQPYTALFIEFIAENVDHKEEICTFSYTDRDYVLQTSEISIFALKQIIRFHRDRCCVRVELDGTRVYRGALPDSHLVGEIRISPRIYSEVMRHHAHQVTRTSSLVHWTAVPAPASIPASVSALARHSS